MKHIEQVAKDIHSYLTKVGSSTNPAGPHTPSEFQIWALGWMRLFDFAYSLDAKEEKSSTANTVSEYTDYEYDRHHGYAAQFIETVQDLEIDRIGPFDRTAIVMAMDKLRGRLLHATPPEEKVNETDDRHPNYSRKP